jgi:hypothetical protein
MKNEVLNWLKQGSPLPEGIRLYTALSHPQHPFIALLRSDPDRLTPILRQELATRVGITLSVVEGSVIARSEARATKQSPEKFRFQWTFLNTPDCPQELKILAADKITAYHRYTAAHDRLFDCTSLEEMRDTAQDLMRNFLENRAIIDEFRYYRDHKTILGKHPIFSYTRQLRALRKLNPVQLVKRRINLEHNIWRIEYQLSKNDKPHLRTAREQSLRAKKMQLVEVNHLISQIE